MNNLLKGIIIFACCGLTGCKESQWNNPYPNDDAVENKLYTAFSERPKHLDPARSYSSNEWTFVSQIYEPPLQYHYLHRPYRLEPQILTEVPKPKFYDKQDQPLPEQADPREIAYSVYTLELKKGIRYQPHPSFVASNRALSETFIHKANNIKDFPETDTRELIAEDLAYQIKRLAYPKYNSPIFGFMTQYLVGLAELRTVMQTNKALETDIRDYQMTGLQVIDRYHLQIKVKGKYPQFKYWLAMPFFSPMPWEAIHFYAQPGMQDNNITIDWYPVGTGAYYLVENNPERKMVMRKNPNFHGEHYPNSGEASDESAGLLASQGLPIPFIDEIIFSLEKESIPYWSKFIQGYYDNSGISSDSFDSAVDFTPDGGLEVSDELKEKGVRLNTTISPTIMYWGFNYLDPVVGGDTKRAKALRQAVSIAFDVEEFITIFANGRGIPAQGALPPGIFGHDNSANTVLYDQDKNKKSLEFARSLMVEAGYPNGIDSRTGEPLSLYFDAISSGDPDEKAIYAWLQKQFAKLNINLLIRGTDYNRFQDKMKTGKAQMFFWGWNADYPDPENFLFLFYGPNSKAQHQGENAANYQNSKFDRLFDRMRSMPDGPARLALILKMQDILRNDAPWIFGYHPQSYTLSHQWNYPNKPNAMARNTIKYNRIKPRLRAQLRQQWNEPLIWPMAFVFAFTVVIVVPAVIGYRRKERQVRR